MNTPFTLPSFPIEEGINNLEKNLILFAARLGPWLAPVPPAYFIARASYRHLEAPLSIAIIMAIAVELVGIATTHNALTAWTYNQAKRKSDPEAPLKLAAAMATVYLVIGILLSTLLEVWPSLATIAPALFFVLAGVGYASIALSADHKRRTKEITQSKIEARAIRAERKAEERRTEEERRRIGDARSLASKMDLSPTLTTDNNERSRTSTDNNPSVQMALEAILSKSGPQTFRAKDAQGISGFGKTITHSALNLGIEQEQLERTGRGVYKVVSDE